MRIEIDPELEKVLDQIRAREWRISGKGHSDTVRFLAKYHLDHKAVEQVLEDKLSQIPGIIETSFLKAMRIGITNLLNQGSKTENG